MKKDEVILTKEQRQWLAERNFNELMEHFRKMETVDDADYDEAVRQFNEGKDDEDLG